MGEYGYTLTAMRFSSYIWNMRRLTRKAAKEFGKAVKEDYKRIEEEGFLDDNKMDDAGRINAKNIAVKYPNLYINLRPLHEARNKFRGGVSRAVRSISPGYKRRLRTIDLVKELQRNQEGIEKKIEALEKKIDKERR